MRTSSAAGSRRWLFAGGVSALTRIHGRSRHYSGSTHGGVREWLCFAQWCISDRERVIVGFAALALSLLAVAALFDVDRDTVRDCLTVRGVVGVSEAMSKFTSMRFLELKVPPPVVGLFIATFMWLTARAVPTLDLIVPWRNAVVLALLVSGVCVGMLGVVSFRRARTTVNPLKPERSSCLVMSGIYRYTRNPMYLGMLLILLGWAVFLANIVAVIFLPAFILYLNRFQIRREEKALASVFGHDFATYRLKVRRWL